MAELEQLSLDVGGEPGLKAQSDPPPGSLGQDLCRARQRNGKMVMDVWRELKIAPHHLAAIEKNCFEALPGRAYAIGFVRSYATWLGLDPEQYVARLKAEMAAADLTLPVIGAAAPLEYREQPEGPIDQPHNVKAPLMALRSLSATLAPQHIVAGLMIAVLIYTGYYVVSFARHVAPAPVIPVPARLAAEVPFTSPKIAPHPSETPRQSAAAPHETALLPPADPAPVIESAPLPAPTPAQPVSAVAEPPPNLNAQLPLGEQYGTLNRNSRVVLRVHRPIHIAVLGNRNHVFIDRNLGSGDTYRVPNLAGLKLSVPDAGAVEVILDGNTVGFAGKPGSAARGLSLDPKNIISRYHWQQS